MKVQDWLQEVAERKTLPIDYPDNVSFLDDRKEYDVYVSKFDGSYITQADLVDRGEYIGVLEYLAEHEVTKELTHGVGFSEKEQKWYGWSHRTGYGFRVGSTCERGDCHYRPVNKEDLADTLIEFYSDVKEDYIHPPVITYDVNRDSEDTAVQPESGTNRLGLLITWTHKETGETMTLFEEYPSEYGRGEWVAKTMADAKQMAIDFNEGVS